MDTLGALIILGLFNFLPILGLCIVGIKVYDRF